MALGHATPGPIAKVIILLKNDVNSKVGQSVAKWGMRINFGTSRPELFAGFREINNFFTSALSFSLFTETFFSHTQR